MAMASSTRSISYTYDVFLSFRGPDTRKSFTGHLYAALTRAGIRTFLDDKELETGKRISAELPTAIEHSSMSIVVLSKNYAHSRWCLDELLQIVECMDTRKQLVIPDFYDVEPWEVRHQGGSFAEAFARHSSCWDTQKLETWKSALTRVADLKGWDVAKIANGCEATVILQVVRRVYCVLKTKTCLTAPIKLVGMSSRIAEIKSRWDDRSTTGANFIGFYGMGGVGKTTTANAFYDLIRGDSFEGQYVLENIGERSRKGSSGLLELQERLLSSILDINNLRLDSLSMGTAWMSKKISTKKVLLIFDDIDKPDQVRALVGERSWFGPGSTVMITTRDKGLLQMIPVDVEYEIKLMEVSESEELFSRHAFEGDPAPEPHKKLLHDIVHYCGGLPLALQILGSHLFNKPLKEWKRTLDKVRLVPMFEIQDKLRISYDGLDVDEKTIFLDIACLFIGDVQDETITILNACNPNAAIGISSLIKKCLLTVKGMDVVCLDMHDLLRDMGRHIVREESQRIGERSRLWLEEETLDVLKYNKGTESVQCIIHASYHEERTFRTEAFEKMQYLRLLRLYNVNLKGSFQHIFTGLKSLCWQKCPLNCLPSTFEPQNLVVLDLRDSKELITVWEDILVLRHL
ncbi:TMV resistance protein N isoform X2 [Daucus carota subsp. sativus]|uniref:TMV resistance protein N isoform X2 n=1 Tax=Daucus carota subsp. sativus TaxID=79200 RepID=UPI003082CF98